MARIQIHVVRHEKLAQKLTGHSIDIQLVNDCVRIRSVIPDTFISMAIFTVDLPSSLEAIMHPG